MKPVTRKKKIAIATAVATALMVLFPQVGDSILVLLQTVIGFVPQLELR